jgi:hypothetical protein
MHLPTVKPLPARVDLDAELVDLYVAEGYSRRIASAFLSFDLEPPTPEQTLTGFTTFQSRVLDATAPEQPTYLEAC